MSTQNFKASCTDISVQRVISFVTISCYIVVLSQSISNKLHTVLPEVSEQLVTSINLRQSLDSLKHNIDTETIDYVTLVQTYNLYLVGLTVTVGICLVIL